MSTLQHKETELRYLKRKNLDQEAQVIGNYYRDLIRSYGVDCIYQHLGTDEFENFNSIVDRNAILKKAYGYNITPDYHISSHMVSYMEVEGDIFNLNKFGVNSNTDVNFYFDSIDFACSLATKLGQYREYKIFDHEIHCNVPELSAFDENPVIKLNLDNKNKHWKSEILDGKFDVEISSYGAFDVEHTVPCHVYEHSEPDVSFPANGSLYRSLEHEIKNDRFLDVKLLLTYKVCNIADKDGMFKPVLFGIVHGSVLYFDIESLGKYAELIHPNVGDLVTIDFPDDKNNEKYEITECYDKLLTQDGISPLLHKYIWKCKARRYVNCNDAIDENESSQKIQEMHDFDTVVSEQTQRAISLYPDDEDLAYGGHSGIVDTYDSNKIEDPKNEPKLDYDYLDENETIDIMNFDSRSKLVTNSFDLFFIDAKGNQTKITTEIVDSPGIACFESNQKWLKATRTQILFNNIEGNTYQICKSDKVQNNEFQTCLESLYERTLDTSNMNRDGDTFFKFSNCRTYLYATDSSLYAKFDQDKLLYKIV